MITEPQRQPTRFTPFQRSLLRMFEEDIPNEDLQAIQKLASNYFMDKLQKKITESAIKQGYTQDDFDAWLNDPNQ